VTSRSGLVILGLMNVLCMTGATAQDQTVHNLPQAAFKFEEGCHQAQAARLKSLPEGASEVERMQLEITDSDVCPCVARAIIEVKDQQLAERILAEDKELQQTFFEPAFQQCSVSLLRKTALPACKEDVPQGTLKPAAAQAACQCYADAVAKLDDTVLRDDAVAAYRNYEARAQDPTVKPYTSKLESIQADCIAKQKN
jgi:hypothetical protein